VCLDPWPYLSSPYLGRNCKRAKGLVERRVAWKPVLASKIFARARERIRLARLGEFLGFHIGEASFPEKPNAHKCLQFSALL